MVERYTIDLCLKSVQSLAKDPRKFDETDQPWTYPPVVHSNGSDIGANAMALPITVGGQPGYGVLVNNIGTGYRNDNVKNVPTGSQPEGEYVLTSSNLTSGSCCFDFGSAETNDSDDGNSTMNAIYCGTACWTDGCTGSGPWVGGDLENGMYFSNTGPEPVEYPERDRLVRIRLGEEQRHDQLHPEIRQRTVRRPDPGVRRITAQRLQPDEGPARHRAGHRRRQ